MYIFWLILFGVLLIIEMATVDLVSIWFAAGALGAAISTIFTDNIVIQVLVFCLLSAIILLITRPLVKKFSGTKKIPLNLDSVIGKEAVVTEKIEPRNIGEVRVDGKNWSAISEDTFDVKDVVKVTAIDGVKLRVEKIKKK